MKKLLVLLVTILMLSSVASAGWFSDDKVTGNAITVNSGLEQRVAALEAQNDYLLLAFAELKLENAKENIESSADLSASEKQQKIGEIDAVLDATEDTMGGILSGGDFLDNLFSEMDAMLNAAVGAQSEGSLLGDVVGKLNDKYNAKTSDSSTTKPAGKTGGTKSAVAGALGGLRGLDAPNSGSTNPARPGSRTGGDPAKDTDGDGTPDSEDDDMDGDGIPNDQDDDIDGDGIPNDEDPTPYGIIGKGGAGRWDLRTDELGGQVDDLIDTEGVTQASTTRPGFFARIFSFN